MELSPQAKVAVQNYAAIVAVEESLEMHTNTARDAMPMPEQDARDPGASPPRCQVLHRISHYRRRHPGYESISEVDGPQPFRDRMPQKRRQDVRVVASSSRSRVVRSCQGAQRHPSHQDQLDVAKILGRAQLPAVKHRRCNKRRRRDGIPTQDLILQ